MYFSQTQKEIMKNMFKFPQWKPKPNSNLEQTKWIKEFKKINNF